ncbi:Gag polyprotein [Bienertia sinuspersici]
MTAFVEAIRREEEEQKLFQFLNGLNEQYSTLRSHILMISLLPNVEAACGMIQQEESQQEIFTSPKEEHDTFAMLGKKTDVKCHNYGKGGHNRRWACKVCGQSGHSTEQCWLIKGFPNRGQRNTGDIEGEGNFVPSKNQQGKESGKECH